ncbi:hypothetical protein F4810DRAFT_104462 [Camillea tinctor]|nr:hypothetical protein F4810DRAFT_104462 [Camillea tinctor]
MVLPRRTRIWALLCVAIFFQVAVAGVIVPYHRRQDVVTSPTTAIATETQAATTATSDEQGDRLTATPESSATRSSSVDVTTSTTSIASDTPIPSAINGNNPSNNSVYTTTIAPGELPLQPVLTPGWGVAGAIMMTTGIVLALIGIKNTWLHTFFSAAYLASLSVTVLILYVMTPPVPVAIQGAYVVAVVCTGLIIGGAATLFRELTEGLGCLLGGFCVGMWLLTLRDGGLVQSGNSKIIFIIVFTVAGYGFYFSRYTRPYALISMMSFAGATVTVLGIDCFSRAGLKEFWAYIWNLNDKVFPFGADTYPMTKGIRVEVALIVVITLMGIISQLKLWRVIEQHRTKRAEARAEAQRHREEEEVNVGRQVEEETARERQEWENVYGDGPRMSSYDSGDSGVGYVDPEKADKFDDTQTTIKRVSSDKDAVEMEELTASGSLRTPEVHEESKYSTNGLMVSDNVEESRVTVMVARDEVPNNEDELAPMPEPDEKEWLSGTEGESRRGSTATMRYSYQTSRPQTLEVTPLPFRIPDLNEEGEEKNGDDRSSFATFADEDSRSKRASMGSLLMNRLSVNSGNLLRSLSQRSRKSKGKSTLFQQPQSSQEGGESVEVLVPHEQIPDDAESIAATVDGMSVGASTALGLSKDGEKRWTMMDMHGHLDDSTLDSVSGPEKQPSVINFDPRHFSTADTVAAADFQEASALGDPTETKLKRESTLNSNARSEEETATVMDAPDTNANKSGSLSVSASSVSLSLTKDRLPSALPRVALSYRTNEWAKHLGLAEAPEIETLQLNEYPSHERGADVDADAAVPVNVEELQQTAESGVPPTSIRRSESSTDMRMSRANVPPAIMVPTEGLVGASAQTSPVNTVSPQPPRIKNQRQSSSETYILPIKEGEDKNRDYLHHPLSRRNSRNSMNSSVSASLGPRPPVPGVVSYSSPQTLLGQREMYLRNKSQPALFTPSSGLEPTPLYAHTASQLDLLNGKHADDLPLSQRKEFLRQSSLPLQPQQQRPSSSALNFTPQQQTRLSSVHTPSPMPAEALPFDSHQPQRYSAAAPRGHREAKLANFRQSVAADLRASSASFLPQVSTQFQAQTPHAAMATTMNSDEELLMNQQRSAMLSQREHEAQRREAERRGREQAERAFEERMRRGELMDAHRDAMRRMQGSVRER